MLCVTNWNAVLELRTHPYGWITKYFANPNREIITQEFSEVVTVADPDAIDTGKIIRLDEIKLVARIKHLKCHKDNYL